LVQRGGADLENPAPCWSELVTWPASKQGHSISLFVRFVNNYFRFSFVTGPCRNGFWTGRQSLKMPLHISP